MLYVTLAFLGLTVGFASSLLGLGGSVFIIPLLPLFIDLTLKSIIYTSILCVLFVTAFNVIMFTKEDLVDWRLGLSLFPLVSAASFLSSKFSHYFSESIVKYLLIATMLSMVLKLLWKPKKVKANISSLMRNTISACAGLLSGALAGLTGIGSGVILGPTLLSLNLTDHKKVSPTINLLIFFTCLFSTLGNLSLLENFSLQFKEPVKVELAMTIFICSLLGSWYGRKINSKIDQSKRKIVIAITLSLLAFKVAFF